MAFTHSIIAIFLFHGVWIEDADHGARLSFPVFLVHLSKQQKGHIHIQVMEVIQLPNAEGLALEKEDDFSKRQRQNVFISWKRHLTERKLI